MFSQIMLIGHLGADVESKKSQSGDKDYANFSVAVKRYAGKGKDAITEWYNVTAFGHNATYLGNYARKGMVVGVVGEPTTEHYETKDGEKKTSQKVMARDVVLIGTIQKSEQSAAKTPAAAVNVPDDDSIPF